MGPPSRDHGLMGAPYDIDGTQQLVEQEVETMEFLVEFDIQVPEYEVEERMSAEAAAAAELARAGHLVRLWRPPFAPGERKALGLYRADSGAQLDGLLGALPLNGWMQIRVTPLEPHPSDPK